MHQMRGVPRVSSAHAGGGAVRGAATVLAITWARDGWYAPHHHDGGGDRPCSSSYACADDTWFRCDVCRLWVPACFGVADTETCDDCACGMPHGEAGR